MSDTVRSILTGTIGLDLTLVAAIVVATRRRRGDPEAAGSVVSSGVLALGLQFIHFVEEAATGFPIRFPPLLGLDTWPPSFFISFNLAWIAIWIVSIFMIRSAPRVASIPLWFLGLAGILNLVAHPVLALMARGYFPGLWTSPLVGIGGAVLLRSLVRWTRVDSGDFSRALR